MERTLCACVLLCLCLTFSSCSKKLSRGKAESIICDFYGYPNVELGNIVLEGNGKLDDNHWRKAVENGFAIGGKVQMAAFTNSGNDNLYQFTPKAKMFIVKEESGFTVSVRLVTAVAGCRTFKEITGITENEQEHTALVEFSCTRKGVTPLGEIMGFSSGDVLNYKVKMTLYDDGWRITEPKDNISPEKYFYFTKDGDYDPTGSYKVYYPSGNIASDFTYKNGKLNGKGLEYYDNGKVKSESTFKDDLRDGLTREYYDNGNKKVEGTYVKNKPVGEFKWFNAALGTLEKTASANDGIFDTRSLILYDEEGKKIDIKTYLLGTWKADTRCKACPTGIVYILTILNDHEYSCAINHILEDQSYWDQEKGSYSITFNTSLGCYDFNRFGATLLEFVPLPPEMEYKREDFTHRDLSQSGPMTTLYKNSFAYHDVPGASSSPATFLGSGNDSDVVFIRQ